MDYFRAYAKALHYKEEEFQRGASSQVVEALISINNKLQQKEAAEGLLEYVMNKNTGDIQVQVLFLLYLYVFLILLFIKYLLCVIDTIFEMKSRSGGTKNYTIGRKH